MHDQEPPAEGVYEPRRIGWAVEPEAPSPRSRRPTPVDISARVLAERQKHEKRRDDFLSSAKGGAVVCAALMVVFVVWPGFWTFILASGMLGLEGYTLVEAWVEHRSVGMWNVDAEI